MHVFHKTSVITAHMLNSKHHSEAVSLGTFPSVQGSDNKIYVIIGISEDFWEDFIMSQNKVIKNLILRLLRIFVNILGQTVTKHGF